MFSCKQGQTSGSNITKKMLRWIIFVIITKIIMKMAVTSIGGHKKAKIKKKKSPVL